ncbi:methyltransferase domain-containing protein [Atlantibacter hermannii]|uniref:methyltransferase domain-containing protein n=1 Tax=Atlantibacter hermannii TaxID=565 RepID=UPI002FE29296
MMNKLESLIVKLPEKYQTIFGHPQWNDEVARDCNTRLEKIGKYYDILSESLGRPLKILDLGCAQGFFSLSLASKGAEVHGLDFLPANIDVCKALAEENPSLNVQFSVGKIEEYIDTLQAGQFDMAIGLSVFHHLVHIYGLEKVKQLLHRLTDVTEAVIVELAIKEEPLYWATSLPENPAEHIEQCAFYSLIDMFETHLSDIYRPMYIVSNRRVVFSDFTKPFERWEIRPHAAAGFPHHNTRRYYFAKDYIAKVYQFPQGAEYLVNQVKRNKVELENSVEFLSNPPAGFEVPTLLSSGMKHDHGWVVTEILPGVLLNEYLAGKGIIDNDKLIEQVLDQIVILEDNGFYHDDLRTWNIIYDQENEKLNLIDHGSISSNKVDCNWPFDIFQAFFIFINEIVLPEKNRNAFWRTASINPFALPKPYCNWLNAVWQKSVSDISFNAIRTLFLERETLPNVAETITLNDQWIRAQEDAILEAQSRVLMHDSNMTNVHNVINELRNVIQNITTYNETLNQKIDASNVKIDSLLVGQETLFSHNHHLHAELEQCKSELAHYHYEHSSLEKHLHEILTSNSWAVTAPLRSTKTVLTNGLGFVKRNIKRVIKKCLNLMISWVTRDYRKKEFAIKALKKAGVYDRIRSFYFSRLNTTHFMPAAYDKMQGTGRFYIHNQTNEELLLSAHGKEILEMLKKDAK